MSGGSKWIELNTGFVSFEMDVNFLRLHKQEGNINLVFGMDGINNLGKGIQLFAN